MSIQQPPDGYVHRGIPKSTREALHSQAHQLARVRAKSAIEQYLRSFFDTDGTNRNFLPVVGAEALKWITDKTVATNPNDPLYKRTQLTRLYQNVQAEAPAILIVDSSFKWYSSGLGELASAKREGEFWIGQYPVTCQVGVTITALTADQDSTDAMMDTICCLLGPLRNIAGGSEIRPNNRGDQWVVRLPLQFEPSPGRMVDVLNDPKDRLWAIETDVVVDYEDALIVKVPFNPVIDRRDFQQTISVSTARTPVITAPSTVRVNETAPFSVRYWRNVHQIHIDRPQVAILNLESRLIIPRSVGTFRLFITDESNPEPGNLRIPATVAETQITVIL